MIEALSGAALNSGLAIDSLHVSAELDHGFYGTMPIALVLTGSYHQFGAFVAAAASLDRLLTFHDFEIERRGARLTMSLAARSYRAVGGTGAADAAARLGPTTPQSNHVAYHATGRSPFEEERSPPPDDLLAEPSGQRRRLEQVALARLQMVGLLARRGSAFALVRDPTSHVHRVGVGDRIGLHGGRVTHVAFDGMEVAETRSDDTGGWVRQVHKIELSSVRRDQEAADAAGSKDDTPLNEPEDEQ